MGDVFRSVHLGSRQHQLSGALLTVSAVAVLVAAGLTAVPSNALAAAATTTPVSPTSEGPLPASAAPWGTDASSGTPSTIAPADATPVTVSADGQLPSMRTADSDTFVSKSGGYTTDVSTVPLNYRASDGSYQPINDSLVSGSNGTFTNTTGPDVVSIPSASTGAVAVSTAGASVSWTMQGMAATPVNAAGATATYADVASGVDTSLIVEPDGVEQTYTLAGPSATSSFTSDVTLTSGESLSANSDGSISIVGASGAVVGELSAPSVTDSSGNPDTETSTAAVGYTLSGQAPDYVVTTSVASSWLDASDRVFPVTVDPTVSFGTSNDNGCYVATGSVSPYTLCSDNSGTDNNLNYGETADTRNDYLVFGDLTTSGSIPADATVTDARLNLIEQAVGSPATDMDTDVSQVEGGWNDGMTWSTQPAIASTPTDEYNYLPPGVGDTITFHIGPMVQSWVDGAAINDGIEIQTASGAPANSIALYGFADANHPVLQVDWRPVQGQQQWVATYDHSLSDRLDLHVDLADRDLVINDLDEDMAGPGQSLVVRRTYNSLSTGGSTAPVGMFGAGWTMNGGTDVSLMLTRTSVTFLQPGDAPAVFARNWATSGVDSPTSFTSAPGLNAVLEMPTSTTWTITFDQTKAVDTFTMPSTSSTTAWLSSVADANGNTLTYAASGSTPLTTSETDATGSRSVSFTATSGLITGMAEHLVSGTARSWSYTYDSSNRLLTSIDANGKTTRYCYQGATDLISMIITPHGSATGATCSTTNGTDVTAFTYDSGGGVTSITYQDGTSPAITVDFAATTAVSVSDGVITDGVTTETDPYSNATTYSYDTTDRVVKTVDPLGDTTSSTYNTNNNVTAAVSPDDQSGGTQTTTTYSPNSPNVTKVSIPTDASESATYTGPQAYLPNTTTDDLGKTSTITYNSAGQETSVAKGSATVNTLHQGDSGVANCGPSGAAAYPGAVCETEDADYSSSLPAEHRTLYGYDSLGELTTITSAQPDHGRTTPPAETIGYDGQSRPTTVDNHQGHTLSYYYDGLDRLTKIVSPSGYSYYYSYDEDGDLLSLIQKTSGGTTVSTITYTYDALDRLSTENYNGVDTVTTTWDGNSRMLSYSDSGGTVTYGYNTAGGLTSLEEPGGSCSGFSLPSHLPTQASLCTLFAVDKSGYRIQEVNPGSASEQTWTPDGSGRTSAITTEANGSALLNLTYTYTNSSGNDTDHVSSEQSGGMSGPVTNYTYTGEGRLASATSLSAPGGSTTAEDTYCYDPNGNLTLLSTTIGASCPGTATFSYDGANQILTQPYGGSDGYDPDGNETASDSAATGSNAARTTTYSIDQPDQFTIASANYAQTYSGVSDQQRLTTATTHGTDTLVQGVLGISEIIHSASPSTPLYITRDPAGNPIGIRVGAGSTGTHYYYQTDAQGSILRVITAVGAVANSYTYTPYGQQSGTTTLTQPLGYDGAYTDQATGLIYLNARYYDPTQARFTQPDPRVHPGDVNQSSPYPYAGDDPISNNDATGEGVAADIFGGLAAVSFVAGSIASLGALDLISVPVVAGLGALSFSTGIGSIAGAVSCLFLSC